MALLLLQLPKPLLPTAQLPLQEQPQLRAGGSGHPTAPTHAQKPLAGGSHVEARPGEWGLLPDQRWAQQGQYASQSRGGDDGTMLVSRWEWTGSPQPGSVGAAFGYRGRRSILSSLIHGFKCARPPGSLLPLRPGLLPPDPLPAPLAGHTPPARPAARPGALCTALRCPEAPSTLRTTTAPASAHERRSLPASHLGPGGEPSQEAATCWVPWGNCSRRPGLPWGVPA